MSPQADRIANMERDRGVNLHLNPLSLYDTLSLLAINPRLPLPQPPKRVRLRNHAAAESHNPEPLGLSSQPLGALRLANARRIEQGAQIKRQVARIAELTTDSQVPEDGVAVLVVGRHGGSLDVLDILAGAHHLAHHAELLLHRLPWLDRGGRVVGAQKVPGVEAGKVLEKAQELVAADGGGDEFEVVRDRGVVDEGVGDHFG